MYYKFKKIVDDILYIIEETINYINEHLSEHIEVNALAQIAHWKTLHYIRVFTKFMDVTPYQQIIILKIEKTKVLLMDKSIPITSIAFELGFQSYNNFINAFEKITDTTPEAFRNIERLNKKMHSYFKQI